MTDINELLDRVGRQLRFVSAKGFIDCAGSKCRQLNCEACFSEPVAADPDDALEALSTLCSEVERLQEHLALAEGDHATFVRMRSRIKELEEQMATARKFATLRRLSAYEKALREIAEAKPDRRVVDPLDWQQMKRLQRIARQALAPEGF